MTQNPQNETTEPMDDEAVEAVEAEVVDDVDDDEAVAGQAGGDTGPADNSDSKVDDKDQIAQLQSQLADTKDKYVRLKAEWDNYRKRTAAERAEERSRANERLVTNLLQVLDDMERAIDNASGNEDDPMLAGVKAIYSKMTDVLTREGLEAIDPKAGDPFDIESHNAVAKVDDSTVPEESICQVYQKGYKMGGKLLRTAMVTVTTGGPKRQKPTEE